MTRVLLGMSVAATAGCGGSKCEELCSRNADCLEQEIATFESSWDEWTGFADRSAYEVECVGVFEQSEADGAERRDLRNTCRAELNASADPCGSPSP